MNPDVQKNIEYLLVAKNIDRAATAGTTIDAYDDLSDGEVVWANSQNVVVDTGALKDCADYTKLKLLQRSGTQLLVSDLIDITTLTGYKLGKYSAGQEQIYVVGYNGTDQSTVVANNTAYNLRLRVDDFRMPNKPVYGSYVSDASATQEEVIANVYSNFIANASAWKENPVKAEVLCNHAGLATSIWTNATFTNGSKYVAYTGTDPTDFVATDWLRVGTATTDPVYLVTAIDATANIVTLDTPYQGTTGTSAANAIELITSAQAGAANFGIKFTGVTPTFTRGKSDYRKLRFNITLEGFGSTVITETQGALEGTGTYYAVSEMEDFLQGNEMSPFRNFDDTRSAPTLRTDAASTQTFDLLRLEWRDDMQSGIGPMANSPKRLTIAMATGAGANRQSRHATSGIVIVADDWIVTSHLVTGKTVQIGNLT